MSRPRRRPVKRRSVAKVEHLLDKVTDRCYFCGHMIAPDARVRRFHELTVHESCYQREAAR